MAARAGVAGLLLVFLFVSSLAEWCIAPSRCSACRRIMGTQRHPGVRGQSPSFLRTTRFAELAAGARQHPGQTVNSVVLSRHG